MWTLKIKKFPLLETLMMYGFACLKRISKFINLKTCKNNIVYTNIMEIVTLHELKDSYIKLQKQRETRRRTMKKYRATKKGKAALARANKKYNEKKRQQQALQKK